MQQVDVFIAGGGLAGLTLARQLRREMPSLRLLVAEKRRASGARSRATRSASRASRSARTTSRRSSTSSRTCAPATSRSSACATSSLPATTAIWRGASSSDRRDIRRCRRSSSIAAGSRTTLLETNRRDGIEVLDRATVREITLRQSASHDGREDAGGRSHGRGALDRRRERPRRPDPPAARI